MTDCSQYAEGSFLWQVCQIECDTQTNAQILLSNSTPLTGQAKIDFENEADDAASKASTAQGDDFFSGLTPAVLSRPSGTSWQDWYEQLASAALAVVTSNEPSQSEKQQALNDLYTIEEKKSDYVDAYT